MSNQPVRTKNCKCDDGTTVTLPLDIGPVVKSSPHYDLPDILLLRGALPLMEAYSLLVYLGELTRYADSIRESHPAVAEHVSAVARLCAGKLEGFTQHALGR